ncbi:MAG: hypothetical protein Mars2KO_41610 [Maribacter sp.]
MKEKFLFKTYAIYLFIVLSIFSCGKDDDGGSTQPQNNAPEIQAQSFNASEAIDDTTVIGRVVATDAENDDLTFTINTNSDGLFEITDTGDISLASNQVLDFETAESHTLSIEVTDGEASANADVTIAVVDVNENQAPLFAAQTFSVTENVIGRGGLVATLVASDPDGDDITFDWNPNGSVSAFELNTTTGDIRTVNDEQGDLDFETTPQYIVSVIASDGELTTQADITINVTDFNDRPEASDQTFTAAEDIDDSVLIGQIVATDQDGNALTFSVDIDNDLKFELSSTGEIRLRQNASLDFETKTSHQISVDISDGTETIRVNITVDVTDVDENAVTVSTLAGSTQGNTDGTGSAAQFNTPRGLWALGDGGVFVVDSGNKAVKRVTPAGVVTTLFSSNQFGSLRDIAVDDTGNIYLSDTGKHVIWKMAVNLSFPPNFSYTRSVFAGLENTTGNTDGNGTNARLNEPRGLTIDTDDNLYIADSGNFAIRKITPTGDVSTVISANSGLLNRPEGLHITRGGTLYYTDYNRQIVGIANMNGSTSYVMGRSNVRGFVDGAAGGSGLLNGPTDIVTFGSNLYMVSNQNNAIRKITFDGVTDPISTIASRIGAPAGDADGIGSEARFRNPIGIAIDRRGNNLIISDTNNHRIRKITLSN